MSKLRLVVFGSILLALIGASGLASAQQISPFFFGMSMTGGETGGEPWPVDNFRAIRLWDAGTVSWAQINPAPGVYDWRELNIWMNHAQQNNNLDLMYTFGRTPTWASSHPTDTTCGNETGSCDAPDDLNSDGTGPNLHWKDFVTAIATHSAGRIRYWELWDEFPNPYRWNWLQTKKPNTVQQLVRMAQDARTIIKRIDPKAVIVSDSGSLRYTNDFPKWTALVQAGALEYADVIAFHGYTQPNGPTPPNPETLVALLDGGPGASKLAFGTAGFLGFLQANSQYGTTGKPLWDTEASWAENILAGLSDHDEEAGFAARFNLLHQSLGVQRFFWYEWDNSMVGTLYLSNTRYDLALPNSSGNVSTMLGFGDGSFQAAVDHGVGSNPVAAAVGDFNNDGIADIVVANEGSADVTVLLGNGDGTFEAGLNSNAGNSPIAVATGDFNKTGNLGVVVVNGNSSNSVSVLIGNGKGTFAAPASYPVGTNPVAVAVGDFNQDGYPDIAVANSGSNNVTVLLNNQKGGFTSANYPVGNGPSAVAVGNFVNGNNFPDLAVTNATDGTVGVLLNNGNGTFGTQAPYNVGSNPSAVAVGILCIEKKYCSIQNVDMAVANEGSNNVSVLMGNGKGGFATAVNYNVGSEPIAMAIDDVNGDGVLDIVTANKGDGTISSVLGKTKGGFHPTSTNTFVGSNPLAMAVGAFSVIGKNDPGTLEKGGWGYQASYNWTAGNGNTLTSACTGPAYPTKGVWTCNYTGPNNYQAQAVWDSSQSCAYNVCTTSQYTAPSQFVQYQTVYCQVHPIENNTVQIGQLPILLENQNPSNTACFPGWGNK